MQIKKMSMMLLSALSCAALLNGCGSSGKEGISGGVALVDEGTCIACHTPTLDPVAGTQLVPEYLTSTAHYTGLNPDAGGCQGCHGGGALHNGVGPLPFPDPLAIIPATGQNQCYSCHHPDKIPVAAVSGLDFNGLCAPCHSAATTLGGNGPNGTGKTAIGIHAAQVLSATTYRKENDCVGCHNIPVLQHGPNLVNDNSGVRTITGANGEFEMSSRVNTAGYRAHHIYNGTGVDPQNAQCIACHLEGKAGPNHSVVVDTTVHMTDTMIHLRDGNIGLGQSQSVNGGFAWDPANPNHTLMDQFCMSCHNSSGAVTAYANMSSALHGMTPIANAQPLSPMNPFGDQLTNAYDQKVRPAVVAVYDQMNPSNPSHHAVRGQKYSGRTRSGSTRAVASQTPFTRYSGAGNARIHPNKAGVMTAYQVFGTYSTSGPASGYGPQYPGIRTTMYDAGLFVATYKTLNGTTLGDDSTLHCGDCHSVGQWKPASATAIVWNNITSTSKNNYQLVPTTVAIGAHGSQNEYMLRTSDGTDSLQRQSTVGPNSSTKAHVDGNYVCFLCHTQYFYGDNQVVAQSNVTYGTNAQRGDFGHGASIGPCNGLAYSGYAKKGTARYGVLVAGTATPSIGNLFAMSCMHCHNSGQQNFGGIHGATGTFMSYSTNGGIDVAGTDFVGPTGIAPNDANGSAYLQNVTHKTSYRFMGGESNRYNGGATADKWESQTPNTHHREGCYNLSQTTDATHLWNTTTPKANPTGVLPAGVTAIQNNAGSDSAWGVNDYTTTLTGRFGQNNTTSGWGSCNHHQGSTTTGPTAPTRVIQRPLVY
jgi:hypothetical protein